MAYKSKNYSKFVATAATATLVASAVAPFASAAADASKFTDVNEKYKGAVEFVVSKGANGTSETTFSPYNNIKRGDAAVLLTKVLGLKVDENAKSVFSDVPAYAAGYVNALKDAGITSGKADGKFGYSDNITRGQLAIWITKAFDLKGTTDKKFTDVAPQYKEAVDALVAAGITQGINANQFGTNQNAKRGDYAIFLQRADATKNPAAKVEVVKADNGKVTVTLDKAVETVKAEDFKVTQAINGKAATTVTPSAVKLADDKKTVEITVPVVEASKEEQSVVVSVAYKNGEVKSAAAFKVSSVNLTVESVSALNNKEIKVTFNKAVKEDTAKDIMNYKLTTVTSGGTATIESAKLQADGKTVVITLGTTAKNQETYKLEVKNVKDTAGVAIEKTEKEVKFFDVTAPTAENVEVVAPRTVKINFSEPMATAPTVKLDNGSISTTVTLAADKKSAQVEFGIEPTIGKHELEIQGGLDFAGLKVDKVVKAFEYQKDTTVPTVSVEQADAKTVTLKFSKPVSVKTAKDVTVYHTVNNSNPYAGTLTATNMINGYSDTYTVTFGTPLPEGAVKVFLNTKENAFEDGWGNDVASTELSTSVVVDKTAPVVTGVKAVKDNKLEVTFDEEVNKADAEKLANYILKDASGKVLSNKDYDFVNAKGEFLFSKVAVSYDKKKATITLSQPLVGGNYSLTVKEIKDASYLENKLTSQDITFSVTDTTAWNITTDALKTGDKIRVTFNEAMSTEGLTDLAKYELRDAANKKVDFPKDTKIVVINSKAVEIQLGSNVEAKTIRVSGTLKDASGNTFNELYKEVAISSDYGPALVTDTAKTTATNKVQFEVNQELSGSLNPDHFTANGITFGGASYVNKDGKSIITLTVKEGTDKLATNATPTISVAEKALVSTFGASSAQLTVAVADGIAPSVAKKDDKLNIQQKAATDNIEITFDEALNTTNQSLAATDLLITAEDGKSLVAGVDFTTSINGPVLTVDLTGKYDNYVGKVTVSSKDVPVYIKDAATVGNVANKIAATDVTVTKVLSTVATVTSTIGTVDNDANKIVGIPTGTSLADFAKAITPAAGATFKVYKNDGTTVATDLASNYKLIVTAEDGKTTKTYTLTVQ